MISVSGRPTTTKTRMVGLAQHRHRQQLMRVDEEVTSPLPEPDASRFAEAVIASVRDVAAVALEDYDKGLLSESLCKRAIAAARASRSLVSCGSGSGSGLQQISGRTILTPNHAEFCMAAGCKDDSLATIRANVAGVIERYDLGGLLVTVDKEGCLLAIRGQEPMHLPTRARLVYDNTGAGDAVLAMLVARGWRGPTGKKPPG